MPMKRLPFWRRWGWGARVEEKTTDFPEATEEHVLAAVLAEPPTFERRAFIRQPCNLDVNWRPIALLPMETWPATLCDISAAGVGLRTPLPVPPGTFLLLELPMPSTDDGRLVRAHVVDAREEEEGLYVLGCQLTEHLHPDEVDAFA
jgi:hypothetical protein